mmetsp:Transcript_153531/g.270962  ORF Transcript_153531/g.270962 Transcript_153531/m.270962 type:complete len:423 (+) Transcript_153531:28-1296(+)
MTNYKEEQELELEALTSIFTEGAEFERISDTEFLLKLKPDPTGEEENHVGVTLRIAYTDEYPDTAPDWELKDEWGLSDEKLKELKAKVEETIDGSIGMAMVYTVAEACQDYLKENNVKSLSMHEEMMLRQGGGDGAAEEEEDEEEEEEDPSVTDGSDDEFGAIVRQFQASSFHWSPGKLFETPEGAKEMTEAMLQDMLGKCKCPCDLALIRSPEDFVPQENDFLGVRPGLYVGDYGHAFYGQYRTEVLLVEYISITPEQLQAEIDRPSLVFARPEGEPAPRNLGRLRGIDAPLTFMRGVKQCGDFHVPMGATTFVVVCGPREACEALAEGAKFPERIINRTTGQMERVARAWRGFGTLATPGFRSPSWANGWLVQLQDNDANGAHRFGYVWDRDQDAVVLQWLVAQDTCPFLQRAWLPEDLQ